MILKKNYYKSLLLVILSRLFINLTYPRVQSTNQFTIIISRKNLFNEFKYIEIFDTIFELENVINQIFSHKILISQKEFNLNFDQVIKNTKKKDQYLFRECSKIYKGFLNIYQEKKKTKKKTNAIKKLLKDKKLIQNCYKALIIGFPNRKRPKTVSFILNCFKKDELTNLLAEILHKLIKRRGYLWKHIDIIMSELKFFLIGKDYKTYIPEVAKTYISQTNKYCINERKVKGLNAKYVKCLELILDKKFYREFKQYFQYILHINKILYYFYNRFPHLLLRHTERICDKRFAIPYKGKIYSFNEIMWRFFTLNKKGKYKLMLRILLIRKHIIEKYLLKHLQKLRELPLEKFIALMEREKYYPEENRTKIPLKIYKWLMKYVYDKRTIEYRESYSRPRVKIEKRTEAVEATYPYLPRVPVKFKRDIKSAHFRKTKEIKFHIIKKTRPKIVLQPKLLRSSKTGVWITKNLLKTKLNSKVNIPVRVQRILLACKSFYKNILKKNFYKNFINLIRKFKILYLYKPELKSKISSFIGFILCLIVSPIFRGITEEREYAHQLKVFLNHYLIRLRFYKYYDLSRAFYHSKKGYIIPKIDNLNFIRKLIGKARKIMHKKPNKRFIRFMRRKSFKRLTVRIRSKGTVIFGLMPLFRLNIMAEPGFSMMSLKKKCMTRGSNYLVQPLVNLKVKPKKRILTKALKRTRGYSAAYQINSKLYYFSQYNLFLKKFEEELLPEEDIINKYKNDKFTL